MKREVLSGETEVLSGETVFHRMGHHEKWCNMIILFGGLILFITLHLRLITGLHLKEVALQVVSEL